MNIIINRKTKLILPLVLMLLLASCSQNMPSSETSSSETSSSETSSSETSSSEEISSETSSSENNSSSENEQYTLSTPSLSLNSDTGEVVIEEVENATYYRYYINNGEYQTTTANVITLDDGNTVSVMAMNDIDTYKSSSWSKPITYFAKEEEETTNINIYFHNTNLSPVTIKKGSTYTPTTPSKDNYTFKGYFLDPFYSEPLDNDYIFNKNTTLFAHFVADNWMNNVTYFIKANNNITAKEASSESGWIFIPLTIDEEMTKTYNKKIFSALVSVSNATSSSPAAYLIMDGTEDDSSRTYYKNGDKDFTITTNGTYRIYFSIEHKYGSLNSSYTKIDDEEGLYTTTSLPTFILESSTILDTPILQIDKENECVKFSPVANATHYEYVIDNGEILSTTSTNIPLYQGSYITVRACSTLPDFLSSRWSTPLKSIKSSYPQFVNVYFHGSNRPSQQSEYGKAITRPENNPVKEGYTFINWYSDITYKTLFDFNTILYENTVIYAKFDRLMEVEYELYHSDKTTHIANFEVSKQYSYNEFKTTYEVDKACSLYVKDIRYGTFYGPYKMDSAGKYNMYFSTDHKWDLGKSTERNAYWTKDGVGEDGYTIYFSNNQNWSTVKYYVWDSSPKASWPGENMTYVRMNSHNQQIFKCVFSSSYTNIIFNNGSGDQTVDISLTDIASGTGFYLDKKENGKWTVLTYTYSE